MDVSRFQYSSYIGHCVSFSQWNDIQMWLWVASLMNPGTIWETETDYFSAVVGTLG